MFCFFAICFGYDRVGSAIQIRSALRTLILRHVHVAAYGLKSRLFNLGQDGCKGMSAEEQGRESTCTQECSCFCVGQVYFEGISAVRNENVTAHERQSVSAFV